MKLFSFLLVLLTGASLIAQTTAVRVEATGCKTMNVYRFNGAGFTLDTGLSRQADGSFTGEVTATEPAMRYVGGKPGDALPVIIGDPTLTITGTCGRMTKGKIAQSPLNEQYQRLKTDFQANNRRGNSLQGEFNRARLAKDTAKEASVRAELKAIDARKKALLADTRAQSPLLGRIAALNTYLSFVNSGQTNELDYFVNNYFGFVDFTDAGYNDLPWTYEANRSFSTTLGQAVPNEQLAQILLAVYQRWPAGSRARMLAMSGGFNGLAQKQHPAAIPVAEALQTEFATDYPDVAASIAKQATGLRTFMTGAEAPLFAGPTPEGEEITLESLRGKIVLIDFWASWCGPCRRENPNVVRLYEQYKDQGFEILGVSLDRSKDRWVKAIADDKLTWLHLSDLKGWKSKYAQQYGVTSIPQTVLLDREGKILARNLRGPRLAQRLKQVFSGK